MTVQKKNIKCPHCSKPGTWQADNPYKPFCSERCKLIDLGAWATEQYRSPDESIDSSQLTDDDTE